MKDRTNYWKLEWGCTRNQYRRAKHNAPYKAELDGTVEDYQDRIRLYARSV
jgi:hypothetical protein